MKYYQGLFRPKNPSKYVGDPNKIVHRSGLEKRFFKHFDEHPGIQCWASEEMYIPYVSPIDGRVHRYFVDILIKTVKGEVFMVEIKPAAKTEPPKKKARVSKRFLTEMREWAVNQAKWEAAQKFCDQKGIKFLVMTEKDLKTVR